MQSRTAALLFHFCVTFDLNLFQVKINIQFESGKSSHHVPKMSSENVLLYGVINFDPPTQ